MVFSYHWSCDGFSSVGTGPRTRSSETSTSRVKVARTLRCATPFGSGAMLSPRTSGTSGARRRIGGQPSKVARRRGPA